jgi:hypothetical protein
MTRERDELARIGLAAASNNGHDMEDKGASDEHSANFQCRRCFLVFRVGYDTKLADGMLHYIEETALTTPCMGHRDKA